MHAAFFLRGIKFHQDEVIRWLATRPMHVPVKDANGKNVVMPVSSQLRPITLWEQIFPENEKDIWLTTLRFQSFGSYSEKMKMSLLALRKGLGYTRIPKFKTDKKLLMPEESMAHTQILPIGVKYDKLNHKFPGGETHEFL